MRGSGPKVTLGFPKGPRSALFTLRSRFPRFEEAVHDAVLVGAGHAEVRAGVEDDLPGLAGRDIDVHFALPRARRGFGVRIERRSGRQSFQRVISDKGSS